MRITSTIAGACALAATAVPALAGDPFPGLTADQVQGTIDYVRGNGLHTLFHESGHMLIAEFGLPVLGREEDAVDNLATIVLLAERKDVFDQALVDTADGFWLQSEEADAATTGASGDDSAYYDEHGLDLQRSYAVVCLAVGSDAERFSDLADTYELPAERRERCAGEFEKVSRSWDAVLKPHWRAAGEPKAPIRVVYEPARDAALAWAADEVRTSRILEVVAEAMSTRYALPQGLTFRAAACGQPNAFWDPDAREVLYCYELVDWYRRQSVDWYHAHPDEDAGEDASADAGDAAVPAGGDGARTYTKAAKPTEYGKAQKN